MSNDDSPRWEIKENLKNLFKTIFRKKSNKADKISKTIAEMVATTDSNEDDVTLGQESKEILQNAINFTDIKVEEVMVPRTDIKAAKIASSVTEIKKHFIKTGHTKLPIFDDSLDNIKGYIHIKDILPFFNKDEKKIKITSILRRALFIPESMKVIDLLVRMRTTQIYIAIVVDEYGGTDGMVTMEDLIEEIVGEAEEDEILTLDENSYEVSARIKIDDLKEKLDITINTNTSDTDFETLGGYIFYLCNKIPKTGDIIEDKNFGLKFTIKEAEARFIKTVIIEFANEKSK